MDIQIFKDQLAGLEEKGKTLREQEALFLKAQGLDEQAESARAEVANLELDLEPIKEDIADLKAKKADAVSKTTGAIISRMNEVLPEGEAVFDVMDGVFFGWQIGGKVHPFFGLSGGEKVIFSGAMAHALQADVLLIECAEVDGPNVILMLEMLAKIDKQIIVNTSHPPVDIPKGWNVVEI